MSTVLVPGSNSSSIALLDRCGIEQGHDHFLHIGNKKLEMWGIVLLDVSLHNLGIGPYVLYKCVLCLHIFSKLEFLL